MRSSTLANPEIGRLSDEFVAVIAHRETAHGTKEATVGGERKTVCKLYGTIECRQHRQIDDEVVPKFFERSILTPTTIFCDPAGEELFREVGPMDPVALRKAVEDAEERIPGEKIPRSLWLAAAEQGEKADALLAEGEYAKAAAEFKKLLGLRQESLRKLGQDGLDRVNAKGLELVEEAGRIADPSDRKKALNDVARKFRGMDCAKVARDEIKNIK